MRKKCTESNFFPLNDRLPFKFTSWWCDVYTKCLDFIKVRYSC